MPPGRPPKRPGDPTDGLVALSDNSPAGPRLKQARLDRGPEEFSNVVKNKLQSYTRTGQACDRCKVRKTRIQAQARGKPAVRSANCLACIGAQDPLRRSSGRMLPLHKPEPRMLCHRQGHRSHRAARLHAAVGAREDGHVQSHSRSGKALALKWY